MNIFANNTGDKRLSNEHGMYVLRTDLDVIGWDTSSKSLRLLFTYSMYPLSDGNLMTHFFTEWSLVSSSSTPVILPLVSSTNLSPMSTSTGQRKPNFLKKHQQFFCWSGENKILYHPRFRKRTPEPEGMPAKAMTPATEGSSVPVRTSQQMGHKHQECQQQHRQKKLWWRWEKQLENQL